jgi:phage-related protein
VTSIITLLLTLVGQLLPAVGASTPAVQNILNALVAIVPALIQEAMDMVPIVQNIIAALKNNPATTAAQLVTLNSLDAQCDAAFEDALAKAIASDPKPTTGT